MTRNQAIDSLRGFFHIVMLLDHLPGGMRFMFLNFLGFISPPAGFMFVSGLVAGLVYGKRLVQQGQQVLWRHVLRRARLIYAYHLLSLLILYFFPIVAVRLMDPAASHEPAIRAVFSGWPYDLETSALMLYQPGLYALLPVYFIFTLLMPFILVPVVRGQYGRVAAMSLLFWGMAQMPAEHQLVPAMIIRPVMILGPWNLLAWQLLFVAGLLFGFWQYRAPQSDRRRRLLGSHAGFLVCWGIFLVLFGIHHQLFPNQVLWQQTIDALSDKGNYGPLRLLSFIVTAYMLAYLGQAHPTWFHWRPLAFIGAHSMQVFAFHLFLLTLLDLTLPHVALNWVEQKAVTLLLVLSLYLPAWLHQKFQAAQERRALTKAAPLPLPGASREECRP